MVTFVYIVNFRTLIPIDDSKLQVNTHAVIMYINKKNLSLAVITM